jgi:multiple sugar transport system ATP-binding protein
MRRELKQLHRRLDTTMIYVTHDQVEALTLGDRVAVMNRGALEQVGPPLELYERPQNLFVAGFLGNPPMNLISGRLGRAGDRWLFRRGACQLELPFSELAKPLNDGSEVTLGIRPEDVRLQREDSQHDASRPTGVALAGSITLVELVGDATIVTVGLDPAVAEDALTSTTDSHHCEATSVMIKMGPRIGSEVGDRVSLVVDTRRAHLFDPRSGANVGLVAASPVTVTETTATLDSE